MRRPPTQALSPLEARGGPKVGLPRPEPPVSGLCSARHLWELTVPRPGRMVGNAAWVGLPPPHPETCTCPRQSHPGSTQCVPRAPVVSWGLDGP